MCARSTNMPTHSFPGLVPDAVHPAPPPDALSRGRKQSQQCRDGLERRPSGGAGECRADQVQGCQVIMSDSGDSDNNGLAVAHTSWIAPCRPSSSQDGLISAAYSGCRAPISPASFLHTWWTYIGGELSRHAQQDAHEFLVFFLDALSAIQGALGTREARGRSSGCPHSVSKATPPNRARRVPTERDVSGPARV